MEVLTMEPINYILDVVNPMQMALGGFSSGIQDAKSLQDIGLARTQEARAAEAFELEKRALEEKRADVARQRAEAERSQAELMRLAELGNSATSDDFLRAWVANPAMRQDISSLKTMLEGPKLDTMLKTSQDLYAAARLGNVDAVRNQLTLQFEAAKNSGDEGMAATYGSALDLLNTSPEAAMQTIGTMNGLTILGIKGPEYLGQVDKQLGVGQVEQTEAVRTLQQRAELAGLAPGTPEYNKFMASGGKGPETVVTNVLGDAEGSFAKELAKDEAKQVMKTIEAGQTASRNLVELDNLSNLLGNIETGGTAAVKAWLGELGVATEGLSDIQAFEATVARMIPAQRVEGSGSSSNLDVQQFAKGLPALIKQPGGNQIIIDTLRDINEYDVAASFIAGQVAEWARTPPADRKALEEQGVILSPANGRKAIMDLGSPTAAYKAHLKKKPKPTTEPVVIDGVIIERIE